MAGSAGKETFVTLSMAAGSRCVTPSDTNVRQFYCSIRSRKSGYL